jgi:predicted transcriptional regulator
MTKINTRPKREHTVILYMYKDVVAKLDKIAEEERCYRNTVIYNAIQEFISKREEKTVNG